MCFFQLSIYTGCGHAKYSKTPLKRAPPCSFDAVDSPIAEPTQNINSDSSDTPPASSSKDIPNCSIKESHPMHTHLIPSLCATCNQERHLRLARFDIASAQEAVNRKYMRAYAKNSVEIQGKKMRPLKSGYKEGKSESDEAADSLAVDRNGCASDGASLMSSWDGKTLREESMRDSSGEKEAVTSARSSSVEGTMLKRESTAEESVVFVNTVDAGGGVGEETDKNSLAKTVRSFFTT